MLNVDIALRVGSFDLEIAFAIDRELLVLFGPSGSGKSMTLGAIAGLRTPQRGRIEVGERVVFDSATGLNLPPQRRNVGYVVQQLALFPHLDVARNIAYGLGGLSRAARRQRVEELLALLKLDGLAGRMPAQLSGGQQQRVALARALARPTDVLLLDEPFSALDEALRADLRIELLRLRQELALPVVFVTHDLREAHLLGDRIAVLDQGRVLQFGPREEVFRTPTSRRVAELTGAQNIFRGRAFNGRLEAGGLPLRANLPDAIAGDIEIAIRAELCNLRRLDPDSELPENCYVARVTANLAFGSMHLLRLEPEGHGVPIEIEIAARPYEVLGVHSQDRWVVELPADDLYVFAASPEEAAPLR
ncbi:MAG: ATP-binding cassette domain-containing protein [Dehalococcoidia bacterium]|nr:ATP-binding cassette domain-containing protein [Dehalococcoidia bacterium]